MYIAVRVKKNKKIVGFITGIPVTTNCPNNKKWKGTEINFLCVHKKLRSNRLAPVLIKEITRRVNVRNEWQAVSQHKENTFFPLKVILNKIPNTLLSTIKLGLYRWCPYPHPHHSIQILPQKS